jgi:c-di-GMP-binding flagellar brake protein YcgR
MRFAPQPGTTYAVTLMLLGEEFDATAVVRDTHRREDPEGQAVYMVGMEFIGMLPAQDELLQKFVISRQPR